ncbi:MAG: hypothetical protein HY226_00025 [Candidatus Vogelbacteria bacterium]|nr:hypothetical protein [Candidatus Vogelbacteria bacterium]
MLHNHKVGLAFGGIISLFHAVWTILVASGTAQPILDFIFYLHMVGNPYVIAPFNPMLAIFLIIFTGVVGYIVGYIFSAIYNLAHK